MLALQEAKNKSVSEDPPMVTSRWKVWLKRLGSFLLAPQLKDDRLTLDGSVRQKLIQPLEITGSLPMDMAQVIREGKLDTQAPLGVRVRLPRTSLAAVPTLVPDLRRSEGPASLDVRVSGTVDAPQLAGSAEADISALRLTDPSLPPINDFVLRMRFGQVR